MKDGAFEAFLKIISKGGVCYRSRPARAGDRSFFGGCPRLPLGMHWPRDSNGQDCVFLAQFDLTDLPFRPSEWPRDGNLYLFLPPIFDDIFDEPTLEPILYYSTSDVPIREVCPTNPIQDGQYFTYTGDGTYWREKGVSLGLTTLPRGAFNFSTCTSYHFPHDLLGDGPVPEDLYAAKAALASSGVNPSEASEHVWELPLKLLGRPAWDVEEAYRVWYGGWEFLDPGGALRSRVDPPNDGFVKTLVPLHPFYARWPTNPRTIYYHSVNLLYGSRSNRGTPNPLGDQIESEARKWLDWACTRASEVEMGEDIRSEYRAWCKASIEASFEAAFAARSSVEKDAARSHWARIDSISTLFEPEEQATAAGVAGLEHAKSPYSGQLFGYPRDVQGEVDANRGKTLAISTGDFPNMSLGCGLNVWTIAPELTPNAWQEVVIVIPAD
ncbi:YwqG family protein [Jannaschia sp.]|nr:YwqG family protein [Jannaschia sp.]